MSESTPVTLPAQERFKTDLLRIWDFFSLQLQRRNPVHMDGACVLSPNNFCSLACWTSPCSLLDILLNSGGNEGLPWKHCPRTGYGAPRWLMKWGQPCCSEVIPINNACCCSCCCCCCCRQNFHGIRNLLYTVLRSHARCRQSVNHKTVYKTMSKWAALDGSYRPLGEFSTVLTNNQSSFICFPSCQRQRPKQEKTNPNIPPVSPYPYGHCGTIKLQSNAVCRDVFTKIWIWVTWNYICIIMVMFL